MFKIYKIEHLDTGMKYVGITGQELSHRWKQHASDPNSAIYEALRSDGHRMTMELIEEVDDKDTALRKEQEYIRKYGSAEPHGWNRKIWNKHVKTKIFIPDVMKRKYRKYNGQHRNIFELFHSESLTGSLLLDRIAPMDVHARFVLRGVKGYNHFIVVYNSADNALENRNAIRYPWLKNAHEDQVIYQVFRWNSFQWERCLDPYISQLTIYQTLGDGVILLIKEWQEQQFEWRNDIILSYGEYRRELTS